MASLPVEAGAAYGTVEPSSEGAAPTSRRRTAVWAVVLTALVGAVALAACHHSAHGHAHGTGNVVLPKKKAAPVASWSCKFNQKDSFECAGSKTGGQLLLSVKNEGDCARACSGKKAKGCCQWFPKGQDKTMDQYCMATTDLMKKKAKNINMAGDCVAINKKTSGCEKWDGYAPKAWKIQDNMGKCKRLCQFDLDKGTHSCKNIAAKCTFFKAPASKKVYRTAGYKACDTTKSVPEVPVRKDTGGMKKASGNEAELSMYFSFCDKAYNTCRGHGVKQTGSPAYCPSSGAKGHAGCRNCMYSYFKKNCDMGANEPCHLKTITNHVVSCYYGLAQCETERHCYSRSNSVAEAKACRDCMFKRYVVNFNDYAAKGKTVPGQTVPTKNLALKG